MNRKHSIESESSPWHKTAWSYFQYILSVRTVIFNVIHARLKNIGLYTSRTSPPEPVNLYRPESNAIAATLQKEELIAEVNLKNKELATVTMHLVERGKLLSKVRDELSLVLKNNPALSSTTELKIILRMLSDPEKNRHDWEQFSIHFDEVHRNFLATLKSRYPGLSTTDLKLCAYLRLNLSSKEIAQSMNITVKGVEISRYRLRKKLSISKDINLLDYLLQVTDNENARPSIAEPWKNSPEQDDLAKFLSFFNQSMTAKFISQGCHDFSGKGIIFKRAIAHNK